MPEYLAKTGYKNPADPNDGIFQYTKGYQVGLFEYYDTYPVEGKSFNNVIGGVIANQASILDIFLYKRLANFKANTPETPFLVDIRGNVGYDIEKFCAVYSELASRLVLQDRPDVVRIAKCPSTVQIMAHQFFTPQPVKG